jgi:hypothetical protein
MGAMWVSQMWDLGLGCGVVPILKVLEIRGLLLIE